MIRFAWVAVLCLIGVYSAVAEGAEVAFLLDQPPAGGFDPECQAAWNLARQIADAKLLVAKADGTFCDEQGALAPLDQFSVIWRHQGDSPNPAQTLQTPESLQALSQYVNDGGGLYLSGAALAMVHSLRVEPVRPRLGGPGNDRNLAAMVPLVENHPVLRGLRFDGRQVPLSDSGFPAFSDFHGSGGPTKGMLLARSPSGAENPLVEYQAGKGRIIAMGWRLPHYSHLQNTHRENLERLTDNILGYLGEPATWQPIVISSVPGAKTADTSLNLAAPTPTPAGLDALERAVRDLTATYPDRYPRGRQFLERIAALRGELDAVAATTTSAKLLELDETFATLRREALLANPLLDFDRILVVKRSEDSPGLGLVPNWQSNSSLRTTGYDNEIAVLSDIHGAGELATLYRPEGSRFVGDVDLRWDGGRLLFSMPGQNGRWQVCEIGADGGGFRELPLIPDPDVDNYDACYLPDGNLLFTSTACFTGVPCVRGSSHVSNLYHFEAATGGIRRLTFEQDHDWCPTVLNNGRVLYLRWEYSDLPHFVSRILFHMNPDGTEQMAYYGTNSYWPNSTFFARPCPDHASRFVGVVSGHHDVPRMGELILFDVARGRREAEGVIQRIPGYGRAVEPVIRDGLVQASWPKFLHPWPLSDKYFLVAAKPTASSLWGIYLVDVFDNFVLLKEEPYYALLEPIPLGRRAAPPVVPTKTAAQAAPDAVVHIADLYSGEGLRGVPRGTVKQLRLLTYHFAYHGMGGQVNRVGLDGPWDVKRILGTVPVEADGSASFRIPANTPISLQPLDAEGKAVQLMRSWMVAMPGEVVSCTGCHEDSNSAAPTAPALSLTKHPSEITPWYGPPRGFSYRREVQPVLDHHCIGCHDGRPTPQGVEIPDFTDREEIPLQVLKGAYRDGSKFSPAYLALRSFVRGHTIESDIHALNAAEFHADTTRLVQLLQRGHHNVSLDPEAWDRLITWIDLNTPYHGTWHEIVGMDNVAHQRDRRREMDRRYAALDEDPEAVFPTTYPYPKQQTVAEIPAEQPVDSPIASRLPDWPFDADQARRRQAALGETERTIALDGGVEFHLVRIPPGRFIPTGQVSSALAEVITVDKPYWMGRFEVSNAQYSQFDPMHDSRIEHGDFLQFSSTERGYPVNEPRQPVCRVSWIQAERFCRWLSGQTGLRFSLPTEAQWEWACRAGADTPMWYGGCDDDFAATANLADYRLRFVDTFGWSLPSGAVPPWRPAIESIDDGARVSAPVGSYAANAWGLHDMHGNVGEWTQAPAGPAAQQAVRGGSWYTRPRQAHAGARVTYPAWFRVYDVGFRVVCED